MPVDFTGLNSAIAALTNQVSNTEGAEASAVTLINGVSQQIQKAIADDDSIDQATVNTVNQIIADVTARFAASGQKLGDAVAATPGTPTP